MTWVDGEFKDKKAVVLMARVHPGETNSSFIMKGALDFLLSDTRLARLLRHHFIFRLIPMLNPDGVIYGNTRTSLVGADLNRRWSCPSPTLHPTLYHAKRLVQMMAEEREVALVCDLHGHSIKRKVFMYGCRKGKSEVGAAKTNALIKMIPLMMSRKSEVFSMRNCHFRVRKAKEATSRVVFFKELGIDRSYTLEASFYGPLSDGTSHMEEKDYERIGRDLCCQLLTFTNRRVFRKKVGQVVQLVRSLTCQDPVQPDSATSLPTEEQEKQENESFLGADTERQEERFAMEDAINELSGFASDLSLSSVSSSSGTESSLSDEDSRKVTPTQHDYLLHLPSHPVLRPSKKPENRTLRVLQPPASRAWLRTSPVASLDSKEQSREQSPREHNRQEVRNAGLREVQSKYMQFVMNPSRSRGKSQGDVQPQDSSVAISSVSLQAEQLRPKNIPHTRVIIARSAGAFRSALRGNESLSLLRPVTTMELKEKDMRIYRIHSTLSIGKKQLSKLARPARIRLASTLPQASPTLNFSPS